MIFGNNYNNNSAITAGFPVRSSLQILSDINNDMDLLSNKINKEIMPISSSTNFSQKNLYDFQSFPFQTINNDNINHFYDKEDIEIKELINKANNLTGNFNYNKNRSRFRYNSNRYNNYSQELNSRYEKENEFNNEYDFPMDNYPNNQNRNRFRNMNGYKNQNGGLYPSYNRNSFDNNYNNYTYVENGLNDDYDYYNNESNDERYYLTDMRNNNRPYINNINRLYNEYSRNHGRNSMKSSIFNNRHRFSDIYINNNNRFHEKLNRNLYTPKRQILTYDNDYNSTLNNYPAYRDNNIRKQNSYKRFNDGRLNRARDIFMENS